MDVGFCLYVILCCDYGIDDAAATVDALLHAGEDGYEDVALICIGGNVPRGVSLKNGAKLLDRTAFTAVTAHESHVAVTMDTCRDPLFDIQHRDFAGDTLLRKIVLRARERTFLSGEKGCYIWDDIALKALRHPDWFAYETRRDRDGNELNVARYTFGKPYLEILDE